MSPGWQVWMFNHRLIGRAALRLLTNPTCYPFPVPSLPEFHHETKDAPLHTFSHIWPGTVQTPFPSPTHIIAQMGR